AQEVDEVFVATDPDVEGWKIAWDIYLLLSPYVDKIWRMEFHEVTRHAIEEGIKNRGKMDERVFEAQIVRRVEDRWIGFTLSKILWKKFKNCKLSAGRVQTPVLGWIIDREKEFKRSRTKFSSIRLENGINFVVEGFYKPSFVVVKDVKIKETEIDPKPPYTTDEMIKDASQYLGFSANYTMKLAQDLFETSIITYHRTDSTHVSNVGIRVAKNYIEEEIGRDYFKPRNWKAVGAHECIRPIRSIDATRLVKLLKDGVITTVKPLSKHHIQLYDLIFRRFIASQMKAAKIVMESVKIKVFDKVFDIEGYIELKSDGWTKLLPLSIKRLPKMRVGQKLRVETVKQWIAPKVALFTEGDVVALMKKKEIGRPSTYAKIVTTLIERGYVTKTKVKKKLIATILGIKVYKFLSTNFSNLVSEERTRELEKRMDMVETGEVDYQEILKEIFNEVRKISYSLP
ncbi:MAG TPA: reverse gyrase, partial [Candidatus Aenigmarchaeota archaeon]|nr:reverse gyrase [Candidatus Aenigmarchaeota archaeon]